MKDIKLFFFKDLQESIFASCSCYLGYRRILHLSFTKTNHLQSDICLSPKCQLRNCSNSSTRSLTFFNNFFILKSRRIDQNSFVIVSRCNQRRGSILREFFTIIRTTMINRYFILFGMPVVLASKEGSC